MPGRRRRPSGEPSPLPRQTLTGFGKVWLGLVVALLAVMGGVLSASSHFLFRGSWWDRLDRDMLEGFVAIRTESLTDVAVALDWLRSEGVLTLVRWAVIAVLAAFKRWRHLGLFVAVVLGTEVIVAGLTWRMARIRPVGIEPLAAWSGFAFPSLPYAAFTVTLVAAIYALAVPRLRRLSLQIASAVIVCVGLARVYLGVDRITDAFAAGIIAVAIPVLAFRFLVPDSVYPVAYSRSKKAHLDLSGARRGAILSALHDQLGLDAVDIELFGTEGSGGSTPLRVILADGGAVFAKLYAQTHLRSDRWYKLGRSLLYGALEDEVPYRSVRRLAEHEDHMMRLMEEAGVAVPRPYGVLEITAGREYLTVTEFIADAAEVSAAAVDAALVRSGLKAVRAMWDAGLAHRDIKPANVLVADGTVYLIDHAFGEIRPTAWREAADLANMILTLSLRYPAAEVHRIAAEFFTADDIGEAFAVARGVTIPSELRAAMKASDREVLDENRRLAPPRPAVGIQRWTPRRLWALTVALASIAFIVRLVVLNRQIASQLL